jgi:2-polyprenyl-3-methyl-5-hydroxy-6-metoxy-1,4-benzoquinol methylase
VDKDIFPFENEKFDLITAFDVIEHLLNPDQYYVRLKDA